MIHRKGWLGGRFVEPLFRQETVIGKPRADQIDDRRLGREVCFGDEVGRPLLANGELVGPVLQDRRRPARAASIAVRHETFLEHFAPVRDRAVLRLKRSAIRKSRIRSISRSRDSRVLQHELLGRADSQADLDAVPQERIAPDRAVLQDAARCRCS